MRFSNPSEILREAGLREGDIVADFGCGSGFYTIVASDRVGDTGMVYAIDIHSDIFDRVRSTLKEHRRTNVTCIISDVERVNGSTLADGKVTMVIIANMLFQAQDKRAVLGEAFRILKKGGQLLVVDWADSFHGMGPQKEYIVPERTLEELASAVGFHKKRNIFGGAHHYAMVFSKA